MNKFLNLFSVLIFACLCSIQLLTYAQNLPTKIQQVRARCDSPTRAVSMTYIHAMPGQRENLKQYILKNWFAVDVQAVNMGLMKSFALWESSQPNASEDWDFIVVDTWCDELGYDGVSSKFAELSKKHKSIAIDGKHFEQLGRRGNSKVMVEHR